MATTLFGPEPFTAADGTDLDGYHGLTTELSDGGGAAIYGNQAAMSFDGRASTDGFAKFTCGLNVGASLTMCSFVFDDPDIFSFSALHRKQGTYGTGSYYAYVFSAVPNAHGISPLTSQTIVIAKQVAGSYSLVDDVSFTLDQDIRYYWASYVSGTGLHVYCDTTPWDLTTWSLEATDSSVTGTGECEGWQGDHGANADDVTRIVYIDDWVIYDSIPTPTSQPKRSHYNQQLLRVA